MSHPVHDETARFARLLSPPAPNARPEAGPAAPVAPPGEDHAAAREVARLVSSADVSWLEGALDAAARGAAAWRPRAPRPRSPDPTPKAPEPAAAGSRTRTDDPAAGVLAWLDGPRAPGAPAGWLDPAPGAPPAAEAPGFWLLVTRAGRALVRARFRRAPILLGRGADADLRLDDDQASRRHARLEPDGPGWAVHDAGSANGTFVNGVRVEERRLRDGDRIDVGRHRLVYRLARPDEADVLDRGVFEPRPEDRVLAAQVDPANDPVTAPEVAADADDGGSTPSGTTIVRGSQERPVDASPPADPACAGATEPAAAAGGPPPPADPSLFERTLRLGPAEAARAQRRAGLRPWAALHPLPPGGRWSGAASTHAPPHPLVRDTVLLGGGEDVDVRLPRPLAPRVCAVIARGLDGAWLCPVAAWPYAPHLNGRAIAAHELLAPGDVIEVAGARLAFVPASP